MPHLCFLDRGTHCARPCFDYIEKSSRNPYFARTLPPPPQKESAKPIWGQIFFTGMFSLPLRMFWRFKKKNYISLLEILIKHYCPGELSGCHESPWNMFILRGNIDNLYTCLKIDTKIPWVSIFFIKLVVGHHEIQNYFVKVTFLIFNIKS